VDWLANFSAFAHPGARRLWIKLETDRRMLEASLAAVPARNLPVRLRSLLLLGTVLAVTTATGGAEASDVGSAGSLPQAGPVSEGLQLRVIAVGNGADEQNPDLRAPIVSDFAEWRSVTLLAEIKNVSDMPIRLMGVRYGDSVTGPYIGKSNSDHFAPVLFRYDFVTLAGDSVRTPQRTPRDEQFLELSGARVESLRPGEALVCLLRPLKMRHDAPHWLPPGEFSIRVRYLGTSQAAQDVMNKHWPDKRYSGLWHGELISNSVPVKIGDQRPLELVWGPVTAGLQAAVELRDEDTHRREGRLLPRNEFPLQGAISSYVHLKNVSDRSISFWTEQFRQGDTVEATDVNGKVMKPVGPFFTGWSPMEKWTLQPGEIATVYTNIGSALLATSRSRGRGAPNAHPESIAQAGDYRIQLELNFGNLRTRDGKGNPIPGPDDFQGAIRTGIIPIVVRPRRPEDDPPKFIGRIQFRSTGGDAIQGGTVAVREQAGEELLKGEFRGATVDIPDCQGKPIYVSVRAQGHEEQVFHELVPDPKKTLIVELVPAKRTQFRLLTVSGKPIKGAKVRYFNRSKALAGSGPYPVDGRNGPVWAESDSSGLVQLDSLQSIDPYDKRLGENVYWFYIEPPLPWAPRFVGPLRAGEDLGPLTLLPLLEVRGEVRGSKEELDNFAAEWDQPEAMRARDPARDWDYAESSVLTTTREGDKLTFRLSNLRPGRLRFVSNFQPGTKSVSHEYSKRKPGKDDVVLEVQLTESRSDIVLTSSVKE